MQEILLCFTMKNRLNEVYLAISSASKTFSLGWTLRNLKAPCYVCRRC